MGCKYCTEYEDLPEHIINGEPVGKIFDTCIQPDEKVCGILSYLLAVQTSELNFALIAVES